MERNYIAEYRKLRGIRTQVALARLSGVPRSTLGEIERHKMKGDTQTLRDVAKALGITLEELYVPPPKR